MNGVEAEVQRGLDEKETRFEWSKEVVLKGDGGVRSFVTCLGWFIQRRPKLPKIFKFLKTLRAM